VLVGNPVKEAKPGVSSVKAKVEAPSLVSSIDSVKEI